MAQEVTDFRPDVVGISLRNLGNCNYLCPESHLDFARQIVDTVRENGEAQIILGGSAVSIAAEPLARRLGCRHAIVGEGERSFPALLEALESGADPSDIPGLVTVDGVGAAHRTPPELVPEIEAPARSCPTWLEGRRYRRMNASWPLQTKRGCPFDCAYCVYPALEGHAWRLRPPQAVAEEVERAARSPLRLAEIVDGVFGLPQTHAIECCESIAATESRLPLTTLELNPLGCTEELTEAMNAAGFVGAAITAESGSEKMLANLRKGFGVEDLHHAREATRNLTAAKLWVFLFGGPGETADTARETARFMETLPPGDLVMATHGIRVLPGTHLQRRLVSEGVLSPEDDLLEPTFFYSPETTPEEVEGILSECGFPDHMRLGLTDETHWAVPIFQRVAPLMGLKPPYWRYGSWLNRLLKPLQ